MIKSKIKIREIKNSDINEVLSRHNTHFGDGRKRTPDQWIWEYNGSYPDLFVFTVIEDNNQIVGTQGMIPIYIYVNGKRYLSGKSEDSLLNSKYRGGTLFQELYEYAMSLCNAKNMQCIWGYTPAVKVWKNKLQFSVYEKVMYESILILNLQNTLSEIFKSKRGMVKKIAMVPLIIFWYLYSLCISSFRFPKKSPRMKFSIEYKLRSINDLDVLYEHLRAKYPELIHIDQDEKYIVWRILKNSNNKYKTYFLYEDNILKAYCYAGIGNKKIASLTDFTFENAEAGTFLLRNLLNDLRNEKISKVSFLGNAKNPLMINTFNLLKRFGFLKIRSSMSFVLKNIAYKDEAILYDIKNWYVGGLWTERL